MTWNLFAAHCTFNKAVIERWRDKNDATDAAIDTSVEGFQ